jgi:RHS repeat-associated protein
MVPTLAPSRSPTPVRTGARTMPSITSSMPEGVRGVVTKRWVWAGGNQPAEERDAAGNVTRRFYPQGEQAVTTKFYYTKDHLGSIREVMEANGTVVSSSRYDAWGVRTTVGAQDAASFGFTGHLEHKELGLVFTLYRAYDPATGRWQSRDPIGESGGINLYGYVSNSPINLIDPTGEFAIVLAPAIPWLGSAAISGLAALGLWDLGTALADASAPEFSDCPGNKPPFTGAPGSTVRGGTGSRTYGDDGYPVRDRDWPHPDHAPPGNGDHSHDWDRPPGGGPPSNGDRSPPRNPQPNDPPPPRGPNVPAP